MNSTVQFDRIETLRIVSAVDACSYVPHSVASTPILQKITGDVIVVSFDTGTEVPEKAIRFDMIIQILDGTAELWINGTLLRVTAGQAIVIPAHTRVAKKATEPFKMMRTIIKSGYE